MTMYDKHQCLARPNTVALLYAMDCIISRLEPLAHCGDALISLERCLSFAAPKARVTARSQTTLAPFTGKVKMHFLAVPPPFHSPSHPKIPHPEGELVVGRNLAATHGQVAARHIPTPHHTCLAFKVCSIHGSCHGEPPSSHCFHWLMPRRSNWCSALSHDDYVLLCTCLVSLGL